MPSPRCSPVPAVLACPPNWGLQALALHICDGQPWRAGDRGGVAGLRGGMKANLTKFDFAAAPVVAQLHSAVRAVGLEPGLAQDESTGFVLRCDPDSQGVDADHAGVIGERGEQATAVAVAPMLRIDLPHHDLRVLGIGVDVGAGRQGPEPDDFSAVGRHQEAVPRSRGCDHGPGPLHLEVAGRQRGEDLGRPGIVVCPTPRLDIGDG